MTVDTCESRLVAWKKMNRLVMIDAISETVEPTSMKVLTVGKQGTFFNRTGSSVSAAEFERDLLRERILRELVL